MPIELLASKIVFGGDALGVVDGKTCFIEGALPGERVIAKITQNKKNFIRAKAVKILNPSAGRVTPPCEYVNHCGGCQYQHVTYEKELEFKQAQIAEIFETKLGFSSAKISPIRRSEKEYGYRNSVTLHASRKDSKDAQRLGFIGKDNHSVIPVKNCLLVNESLAGVFQEKFRLKNKRDTISFKLSKDGEIISDERENFFRAGVGNETFLAHSQGFFQNNLAITAGVASQIGEWARGAGRDSFFDLYAGAGTFSILCAAEFKSVYAFEESGPSLEALRMNKEEKGLKHLEIFPGRVQNTFPAFLNGDKCRDAFVLMDPPRQGLDPGLSKALAGRKGIAQLVYLSCDPATLSRDLHILLSHGAYEIRDVIPFDMFPRTKHIEVLVRLA